MPTSLQNTYLVKDASVTLKVVIGDGQFGSSKVTLGGQEVVYDSGSKGYLLGQGGSLVGKELRVTSVVSHTNPSTDMMDVTHKFEGGVEKKSYGLSGMPAGPGQPLKFEGTYQFLKANG